MAESELLTSISSAINTCSIASLIASSVTKIRTLFSMTSASSSGSKTRVMLVLLKSAKSKCYHSYDNNIIMVTLLYTQYFSYLQRVETADHHQGYLEEGEEMRL